MLLRLFRELLAIGIGTLFFLALCASVGISRSTPSAVEGSNGVVKDSGPGNEEPDHDFHGTGGPFEDELIFPLARRVCSRIQ